MLLTPLNTVSTKMKMCISQRWKIFENCFEASVIDLCAKIEEKAVAVYCGFLLCITIYSIVCLLALHKN